MRYLGEAELLARDLNMVWVLPWVLASRARWDRNMDIRCDALDRAEDLVFSGRKSYPFEFYYVGIDAALDMEDWVRVENYSRRLEPYVAREPVGLPTYVAARARAISAAAQGRGSASEVRALMDFAQTNGLLESMVWLDRALERCSGSA